MERHLACEGLLGFFLKSGYVAVVEMERNLDGVVVAGGAFEMCIRDSADSST